MRLVSPLLKHVLYPCLAGTGFLRGSAGNADLCVVTYHGVLPAGFNTIDGDLDGALVSVDSFRRQLRLLKSRYHVISPEEFFSWCETRRPIPPRSVLLTCDDGLLNTLTDMLPILQEERLSSFFFVTAASLSNHPRILWHEELYLMFLAAPKSRLRSAFAFFESESECARRQQRSSLWWSIVKSLSQYDANTRDEFLETARARLRLPVDWNQRWREDPIYRRRFLTLTLSQVQQLVAAGMSIGAHGLSHPVLSRLPAPLAWQEIAESRSALEEALGVPVRALAYPFGDLASASQREFEMAERAGYKCAFLNVDGFLQRGSPLFALPRVHVSANMLLPEFEAHVSGFHQALRRRFTGPELTGITPRN